jgi:hypothetical protein
MIKAYEVHTYRHGRWALSAIFDDLGLATQDAEWLGRGRAHFGVRVIEETWSPRSGRLRVRTVFRSARPTPALASGPRPETAPRAAPSRHADPSRWVFAMVGIVVAGIAAGVALGGLQQLDW